jgi:hypothetical protein
MSVACSINNRFPASVAITRGELQPVQRQCTLDSRKIEIVRAKNLQIAQLVSQTQLMVSLKLVPVAGSANTLKVLTAVWIADSQSMNESRRHNVIDVPGYSRLLEIYSAGPPMASRVSPTTTPAFSAVLPVSTCRTIRRGPCPTNSRPMKERL